MSQEEIDVLLDEISDLQATLSAHHEYRVRRSTETLIIGIYTLYLCKIFYTNGGITRPIAQHPRPTDLLLIVYTAKLLQYLAPQKVR